MRIAHYLTIGTELATSFSPHLENLYAIIKTIFLSSTFMIELNFNEKI